MTSRSLIVMVMTHRLVTKLGEILKELWSGLIKKKAYPSVVGIKNKESFNTDTATEEHGEKSVVKFYPVSCHCMEINRC